MKKDELYTALGMIVGVLKTLDKNTQEELSSLNNFIGWIREKIGEQKE